MTEETMVCPEDVSRLLHEEITRVGLEEHDDVVLLSKIVTAVGNYFETDVCSIYVLDKQADELVLAATVGLCQQGIGRVRMSFNEGLVGLVAQRREPVTVTDAPDHPRFKYFPEAGEEPFHSFLGVPLLDGGRLCGVLVIQTVEPRAFSRTAARSLAKTAGQVAAILSRVAGAG